MAATELHLNTQSRTAKVSVAARRLRRRIRRTYVYKVTIDDGVAPCAPLPEANTTAILSLALCKPAIRRTARPGDVIIGIASQKIAESQRYRLHSIIFVAVVEKVITSRQYFTDAYKDRPDCIWSYANSTGEFFGPNNSNIHANQMDKKADLGVFPSYKNGYVLLCGDFRYFGSNAVRIPDSAPHLRRLSKGLRQGHRVFTKEDEKGRELEKLKELLWEKETSYTPEFVTAESRGCVPGEDKEGLEEIQSTDGHRGCSRAGG